MVIKNYIQTYTFKIDISILSTHFIDCIDFKPENYIK